MTLLVTLTATSAPAQGPPTPVVAAPAVERDIPPSIQLVGSIHADRTATIAAEVSGIIAGFEADEGQFVEPGAVLCQIDDSVARLRLREAEAALAGLRSHLEELENGERQEDIARLKAAVAEAEAQKEKWQFERKRIADLFAAGQSSDKEKHDAEMDYQAAVQRLAQATAAYERARNGTRPEALARARQEVVAQEAAVALLQRDLEKTAIRAPFAGAIVQKLTEVGEWMEAGGAVCTIVAIDTVRVRVDVPENAVPYAKAGRPVTIEIDALRRTMNGTITRVIPLAAPAARTFPVEIDLENEQHDLLPGMFVRASVPAGPVGKRVMVSKDAIVPQGTSKQIYVVRASEDGSSMAIPMTITTGLELDKFVEVRGANLQAGDLVVTRANERLRGPTPVVPEVAETSDRATSQPTATAHRATGE